MQTIIKPLRKCRWCDESVGKVNGELIHTNNLYLCKRRADKEVTVAE